jgi:hypothetical protein
VPILLANGTERWGSLRGMQIKLSNFNPKQPILPPGFSVKKIDPTDQTSVNLYHSLVTKSFMEGNDAPFQPQLEKQRHLSIFTPPWQFVLGHYEVSGKKYFK